jgi:hypothetical protein
LNKLERDYFLVAAKTMIMVVPYRTVCGEALAFICDILQSFKEYLEKSRTFKTMSGCIAVQMF